MSREPDWPAVYQAAERAAPVVPGWMVWRAVNAAFTEYESQMRPADGVPWDQLELRVQTEDSDEALTPHE